MSWHTNGILIKANYSTKHPTLFKQLGLPNGDPVGMISFDDAVSVQNEGLAVADSEGWTVLWGGLVLYLIEDSNIANMATGTEIFQITLEGGSGTAGFTLWSQGRKSRNWLRQSGQQLIEEGDPLACEQEALSNRDEEQAVLQILQSMTLPLEKLSAIPYQMYSFPPEVLFSGS